MSWHSIRLAYELARQRRLDNSARIELRDEVEVLERALRGLREERPNKPPCEMVLELESHWRLELADMRVQLAALKVGHRAESICEN